MLLKPRQREQVLPLPVVLVSTVSDLGVRNVAPWSNVTPMLRPLSEILLISWVKRDTLVNIRATREFTVSVPRASMSREVMLCARDYPPQVDEFAEAGLEARPSQRIAAPGVQGCLAWIECVLVEEISRPKYSLIVADVLRLEVDDQYFDGDGEMDYERAMPLSAMLGPRGLSFTRPVSTGHRAQYREMFLGDRDMADTMATESSAGDGVSAGLEDHQTQHA